MKILKYVCYKTEKFGDYYELKRIETKCSYLKSN